MNDFEIIPMTPSHVDEVARLHQRCFPDYFLTHLGQTFLRRYYLEFCRHSTDYALVACCKTGDPVAGVVVGSADAQAHFRSLYRRNMLLFAPLVGWRVIVDSTIRRAIWQRMAHLRAAARSVIPGFRKPASAPLSDKGPKNQCPMRLLGIAVAPEYRGSGLAARLTECFETLLRQAGHPRVGLSVLPENQRAIAFYRKTGWQVTHASEAGSWFEKDL
ncbi:MAG: GNAT family N-acetyltransferase [Phycisphaerales bacterium]|nr:GNAT family N-acetyltransferase [Phycisphaerales bacterium]